jgi:hypothetical protein
MIYIDQFLEQAFGDFAIYAKMIFTMFIIFAGGYWFVRIPPSKMKKPDDHRSNTLAFRIFGGMAVCFATFVVGMYFTS